MSTIGLTARECAVEAGEDQVREASDVAGL